MPNTIQLKLLENKSVVAEVNGRPYAYEGGYNIVAGEKNATQFQISSVPAQYKDATFSIRLTNAKGYPISTEKQTYSLGETFMLPVGMATAGYGSMLITAKTTDGEEPVWLPLKIKVGNDNPNWIKDASSPTYIHIGKTTTLPPDEEAKVTNRGTLSNPILDFAIPQGRQGESGEAATIEIGEVTTVSPFADAQVENVGTSEHAIWNIQIPQGKQGEGFKISKVYTSIEEMNSNFATDGIKEGQFVIISTSDINDPDNSKLFVKGATQYGFVNDLSGAQGIQGRGIAKTIGVYTVSDSGQILPPNPIWYSMLPNVPQGKYLWNKQTIIYTDDTEETFYLISYSGVNGTNGSEVTNVKATYRASDSDTFVPIDGWSDDIPHVEQGYYLWVKTIYTMSDDRNFVTYSVARQGKDGAGYDGSVVDYAVSDSGTEKPSDDDFYFTVPSVPQGKYLWTRTIFKGYNGNADAVMYSVAYQGTSGIPSDEPPLMDDDEASAGTSNELSRADHQHPRDSVTYTIANNAKNRADSAMTYALDAGATAQAANEAAVLAKNAADEAHAFAETAYDMAQEANNDASAALANANIAYNKAENVETAVEEAKSKADEAYDLADSAYSPSNPPPLQPVIGSNPNLLINSNFAINQRGQNQYVGLVYGVDHWMGNNNATIVDVNNDGSITLSGVSCQLLQKLEPEVARALAGKTAVLSISVQGQVYTAIQYNLPQTNEGNYSGRTPQLPNGYIARLRKPDVGSSLFVQIIGNSNGDSLIIDWVKLEVGEVATAYTPPLIEEELPKCQRYYQKIRMAGTAMTASNATTFYPFIPLPVSMRARPTVVVTLQPDIRGEGQSGIVPISIVANTIYDNGLVLTVTTSGLVASQVYCLANGEATLDAEI